MTGEATVETGPIGIIAANPSDLFQDCLCPAVAANTQEINELRASD